MVKRQWHEHIVWQDDYSIVKGISSIGRATVEQIKLNRFGVVNLRKALFIVGVHPPQF